MVTYGKHGGLPLQLETCRSDPSHSEDPGDNQRAAGVNTDRFAPSIMNPAVRNRLFIPSIQLLLGGVELVIEAFFDKQLFMRSGLHDPGAFQGYDPVGIPHC